jgi:predicted permease
MLLEGRCESSHHMLINFFKTALRNFWRNKTYSFLNIFGLSVGITCAALIFLWVEDELSFDQFNKKKDRLFFVRENQQFDTYTATFWSTPGLMGPAMQAEIPGIANTCRSSEGSMQYLFSIGDKSVYSNGQFAEPSLFTMFTLPFVEGNAATAFKQLYSVVITEKAAKKFFGDDTNVVGRTVRLNNQQDYIVSGVLKDLPENSTLQFEWVAPFEILFKQRPWLENWGNNSLSTYVELKPGVSAASVNKILYNFIQKRDPQSIARPFLFPMNDWRLRDKFDNGVQTGGRIEYVRLFSIIAGIILLIACINFMNLSTARSEKRAKEVGIRKVLGSRNKELIFQFLGEALVMALLAGIIAILLITLTLPAFNFLVQKNLHLGIGRLTHTLMLLAIILVCGLIAGSYPAFYLSFFNPVFVLKGIKQNTGSAEFIRKGLVVLQFSTSIILIISTIIIFQQIQHVKNRNLGFDKNNLLQTEVVGNVAKNFTAIKQDLLNTGLVENAALTDHVTLYGGNNSNGLTWEGKPASAQILISQRFVSPEFFQTTGINLLAGRDIAETDSTVVNKTISVVITQSLEKLMGKGSALGKRIWYQDDTSGENAQVVGVVNDYVYSDMYGKSDPVMFFYAYPKNTTQMYVRFKPQADLEKALAKVETILKQYNPGYPFSYQFVDDQFNKMFMSEELISKLSRTFAILTIFISCLGLFALASYATERRRKEIGVRKVLGASISNITTLLSKDFLKLVVVSCLVAFPLAWWVMHNWLQDYQYRITISWWIFPIAGIVAVLIAVLTISFQSIKAAVANPVKSLRTE